MVAKTIALPNVKRIFEADPGYFICDSDLAQADAQVVAWEAGDEALKAVFRDPEADLHDNNAFDIFGKRGGQWRQRAKAGVHAVNYDVKARTLAVALGITIKEAEEFIDKWFTAHPGIYDWQQRIKLTLNTTRTITNRFGNRKVFFGRVDRALPEALAWIPQSTVALVINRAWRRIVDLVERGELSHRDVQVLLQVHDSLLYQVRKITFHRVLPYIEEAFKVVVPYDDPLIIPAGLAYSDISWGDVRDADWKGNLL